jgi:hypothetical protein
VPKVFAARKTQMSLKRRGAEVVNELQDELELTGSLAAPPPRSAALQRQGDAGGGGGGSSLQAGEPIAYLQRVGFLVGMCYLAWFLLLVSGVLAYEGEPNRLARRPCCCLPIPCS